MAMNKRQKKYLGPNPPSCIWTDKLFKPLHPLPPPGSLGDYEVDDEQSFAEFKEMGKRNPNAEGTGRWKLTPQRRKIGVLHLPDRGARADSAAAARTAQNLADFAQLLRAYVGLETEVLSPTGGDALALDVARGTLRTQGYEYSIARWTRPGGGGDGRPALNVFHLFDALAPHAAPPYLALIAFVDAPLGEPEEEDDDEG
eukprot:CAMPEP_0194585200 /NCGR_PEP_ID=MMETSP0292-20121207/17594_1 /TAXON_ID=39354 /ORGANISM="Heterosigma akashiwo, Strain CCMP2393" /LENGTH=199 /DNA_ID=CAMNT_0039440569 /DNA_START=111 /DNA_END=707 /DNA_ORIENTATION=-